MAQEEKKDAAEAKREARGGITRRVYRQKEESFYDGR